MAAAAAASTSSSSAFPPSTGLPELCTPGTLHSYLPSHAHAHAHAGSHAHSCSLIVGRDTAIAETAEGHGHGHGHGHDAGGVFLDGHGGWHATLMLNGRGHAHGAAWSAPGPHAALVGVGGMAGLLPLFGELVRRAWSWDGDDGGEGDAGDGGANGDGDANGDGGDDAGTDTVAYAEAEAAATAADDSDSDGDGATRQRLRRRSRLRWRRLHLRGCRAELTALLDMLAAYLSAQHLHQVASAGSRWAASLLASHVCFRPHLVFLNRV